MFSAFISILLIVAKGVLAFGFLTEKVSFTQFVLIINPISSIVLYYLFKRYINRKYLRITMIILDFFMPVIGQFTVLLALVASLFNRDNKDKERGDGESFYLKDFEQSIITKQSKIEERNAKLSARRRDFIQPYLDILNDDDTDLKIDVCIKLSTFTDYSAVSLLKIALQDDQYDVRYMASNALGKVEKKFMLEIEQVSKLIEKYPNVDENYINRGEVYVRYYMTGLLDESIGASFLKRALKDFSIVAKNEPSNYFVAIRLAYIYAQLKDFETLEQVCQRALELSEVPTNERNKLLFYLVEAAFAKKEFIKLKSIVNQIDTESIKYDKILGSVNYWRGLNA